MKFNFTSASKVFLLLVVTALHLQKRASSQCTAYFQAAFNSSTGAMDFTPICTYDTSIHPIIYMWDFGDGTTAVEETPSHIYATGNNYLVCLILYVGNGPNCCQDTFCEQVDFIPAAVSEIPGSQIDVSVHAQNHHIAVFLYTQQNLAIRMSLVTMEGHVIPVNTSKYFYAGRNEVNFEMPDYPAGIYVLRIEESGGAIVCRRFILD